MAGAVFFEVYMGVYRKYTIKRTVPLPVVFKCPSCQKSNLLLNPFTLEAAYTDKGTFSKDAIKERESQAKERLDEQQFGLYDQVAKATERRSFINAGYVCNCAHCKQFPLWSKFRNKLLDGISAAAIFVAFIIALVWCTSLLNTPLPASELIPAVKVFIFGNLPAFIVYTIKGIRIRAMGKEYMPQVFKDQEQLKAFLLKPAAQPNPPAPKNDRAALIEKGYIQIRQGQTPNGGDYSEGHYLDKNHNYTSCENADLLIIREFKNDGTLVNETFMHRS